MGCPNCNSDLPEGADYCLTCQASGQTTGLTEDAPHEGARVSKSARETRPGILRPEESDAKVPSETVVTRDDSIVEARWMDSHRIGDWVNGKLNHYEALRLDMNADERVLQSRIAALDRALEQWSKEHDARVQELGKEGKRRLLRLKADFNDRAAYDHRLEQDDRRRIIEDLTRRTLEDVRTSGLLKWPVWERLKRQAKDKRLDSGDLDQLLQSLRGHGVQTELLIKGQAVRSLDDLLAVCDGEGERLIDVFYDGELERWLEDFYPDRRFRDLVSLKEKHKYNPHLGAQLLLWELGEERLILEEEGHRCEIGKVEEWITETCYHKQQDRAELAFKASLRTLENQILENWLDRVKFRRAGERARLERWSAGGKPGLWRVIWEAEREARLSRRPSETAYGQTRKLVDDHPGFVEGHFNHAINCALTLRLKEMDAHLRRAIESDHGYAKKALDSPYFERHKQEVYKVIDPSGVKPDPPGESRLRSKIFRRFAGLLFIVSVVLAGWWLWPFAFPTPNGRDFDYANPRTFRKKHELGVAALAFAPGGLILVTGGVGKDVNLWDVTNGEIMQSLKISGPEARAIAVSPDGKLLATVSKEIRVIALWDLREGLIRTSNQREEEKNKRGIPLVINNHGESSNIATLAPRAVKLGLRMDQELRAIAFSPNNQFLAGVGESQVKLWHLESEQEIQFSGEEMRAPIAFSPDGKLLASGGPIVTEKNGVRAQQAVIWELPSGKPDLLRFGRDLSNAKPAGKFSVKRDSLGAIAFSAPGGEWLASGCDSYKAAIWNVERVKYKFTNNREALFDPADMKPISLPYNPKKLIVAAFSPSGNKLVTVGEGENDFKLWSWNGVSLFEITLHNSAGADSVTSAAFSDDGKWLAVGYNDGTVKVWEGRAKQE